jgi:hypothetical protein
VPLVSFSILLVAYLLYFWRVCNYNIFYFCVNYPDFKENLPNNLEFCHKVKFDYKLFINSPELVLYVHSVLDWAKAQYKGLKRIKSNPIPLRLNGFSCKSPAQNTRAFHASRWLPHTSLWTPRCLLQSPPLYKCEGFHTKVQCNHFSPWSYTDLSIEVLICFASTFPNVNHNSRGACNQFLSIQNSKLPKVCLNHLSRLPHWRYE